MASSATPLHDSLIELAIPDAHAHAIKWYLNICVINNFAYKLVLCGTIPWEMIRFYTFCESVYVVL